MSEASNPAAAVPPPPPAVAVAPAPRPGLPVWAWVLISAAAAVAIYAAGLATAVGIGLLGHRLGGERPAWTGIEQPAPPFAERGGQDDGPGRLSPGPDERRPGDRPEAGTTPSA